MGTTLFAFLFGVVVGAVLGILAERRGWFKKL